MNIVPLLKCPTKKEAQDIIRRLVKGGKIKFDNHSNKRKRGRKISNILIINCLSKGYVDEDPVQNLSRKGWETAVVGKVSGKRLRVALCIRWGQDVLIITCYFE